MSMEIVLVGIHQFNLINGCWFYGLVAFAAPESWQT